MNRTLQLLLTGLAAGDGLGSTSEFVPQAAIPAVYARYQARGWPFRQIGGGPFGWRPGQGTDDTDMAAALVASFQQCGRFDADDVAGRWVAWMRSGPPDIGSTTRRALTRIAAGEHWLDAGLNEYRAHPSGAANGSLMRNGVVAGIAAEPDEMFRISLLQSVITHAAPLCVLCCCAQSWLIAELLAGVFTVDDWMARFKADFQRFLDTTNDASCTRWHLEVSDDLEQAWNILQTTEWACFDPFRADFGGRAGYVLLTLQIALWALRWADSKEPFPVPQGFPPEIFDKWGSWVLGWVPLIGHDADTYGATAGPLLAAIGELARPLTDGLEITAQLQTESKQGQRPS